MAVMDEFREEREALKNGTFKEKLTYFWYYYKWHVIITISVILIIASFVHQLLNRTETVFNAVLLNATQLTQEDDYADAFAEHLAINPDEEDVIFDTSIRIIEDSMDETSYTSVQKLMVYTAAGDLDVMVTDTGSFRKYANSETFHDLRDILSEEQLEKYEPYFYYVDQKTIDEIDAANENYDETATTEINYHDPTRPEEMETPIPVGIYLDNSETLRENFYFRGDEGEAEHIVVGVYVNTKHLDYALTFLDYVLAE